MLIRPHEIESRTPAGRRGRVEAGELALPVTAGGLLPCGATARWSAA